MGAFASLLPGESTEERGVRRSGMEDIPESCVAVILSYLDPPEVAKMARVNRAFSAASSADFIWDPKLPTTYPFILSKLMPDEEFQDKKAIYSRLCSRNSFDCGAKEVWIDKKTGGVCLAISSTAMTITGIDDRRYWNHILTDESRFQTVAYLQQMWWRVV